MGGVRGVHSKLTQNQMTHITMENYATLAAGIKNIAVQQARYASCYARLATQLATCRHM